MFNSNDTSTGSQALTVEINLIKDNIEFEILCMNALSEALNLVVSSQSDFCSGGNTSNSVTGMDRTWSGDIVVRYETPSWKLAKSSFADDISNFNNIPMRITNIFTEEITTFNATITKLDITQEATNYIMLSLEFKIFVGKPVVTPIIPTP